MRCRQHLARFVDDILTDWRARLNGHPTIHASQNYILHYLAPLHYRSSYLDFIARSRYRKIYTRNVGALPDTFPTDCLRDGRPEGWHVLLSSLAVDHHVAQVELLRELLATGELSVARTIDLACINGRLSARR